MHNIHRYLRKTTLGSYKFGHEGSVNNEGGRRIRWTLTIPLENLDFADDITVHSHKHQDRINDKKSRREWTKDEPQKTGLEEKKMIEALQSL